MSLNRFEFIGNLTKDTELRKTQTGKSVANISIAVNSSWKDDGGKPAETNFFRVSAWGALADSAFKYLGKGSSIFVSGRIENQSYEADGKKCYRTTFIAETIEYLSTNQPNASKNSPAS